MNGALEARRLATGVLADLRLAGSGWEVKEVVSADASEPPRSELSRAGHLRVTISNGDSTILAHFTVTVPHDDACVATAEQIQDQAIELTSGAALPPCPGHSHPLSPRSVQSVPKWVCPVDLSHFQMEMSGV